MKASAGVFFLIWPLLFIFFSLVTKFILKLFKKINLGLVLSIGYSVTVIVAVIADYVVGGEQSGWYLIGVMILGLPTAILSSPIGNFADHYFNSAGFYNLGTVSSGISLIVGGGIPIFFNWMFYSKKEKLKNFFSIFLN